MNILFAVVGSIWEFVVYGLWYGSPYLVVSGLVFLGINRLLRPRFFLLRYLYLFPLTLLLAGGVANVIWYWSVHDVKYHYWDYLAEFNPIFRISIYVGEGPGGEPNGPINGATLEDISKAWSHYAIATWAGAFFVWVIVAYFVKERFRRASAGAPAMA